MKRKFTDFWSSKIQSKKSKKDKEIVTCDENDELFLILVNGLHVNIILIVIQ